MDERKECVYNLITMANPIEDARALRKIALERIRFGRFEAFKNKVESLQLKLGDPITLKVRKAGYDDRGPDYVETDMHGHYQGLDSENQGVRVVLDSTPGLNTTHGKESLFILDEYEEIIVVRRRV